MIIGKPVAYCVLWLAISIPAAADLAAGRAALKARDFEAAVAAFKPDLSLPETAFEANWHTGEALVKAGKAKDALDYLEKAVTLRPDHADAQYWWGAANGDVAGDASIFTAPGYAKKCKAAFERALALEPKHHAARTGLIRFHLEAPSIVGGDKKTALKLAEDMLAFDRANGLSILADVQRATGDAAAALENYGNAIREFPELPISYLQRGLMLREAERYDEAVADFRTLARMDPTAPTDDEAEADAGPKPDRQYFVALGRYFLGSVASRSGRFTDEGITALEVYLQAAHFDVAAREPYAHYYLASLYLAAAEADKAHDHIVAAEAKQPDKDLKKLLKQLKGGLRKS